MTLTGGRSAAPCTRRSAADGRAVAGAVAFTLDGAAAGSPRQVVSPSPWRRLDSVRYHDDRRRRSMARVRAQPAQGTTVLDCRRQGGTPITAGVVLGLHPPDPGPMRPSRYTVAGRRGVRPRSHVSPPRTAPTVVAEGDADPRARPTCTRHVADVGRKPSIPPAARRGRSRSSNLEGARARHPTKHHRRRRGEASPPAARTTSTAPSGSSSSPRRQPPRRRRLRRVTADAVDGAAAGSASVAGDTATVPLPAGLAVGDHAIAAAFTPTDGTAFTPAQGTTSYAVAKAVSSITAGVGKDSIRYGDNESFDITVAAPGATDLSGHVTVLDGETVVAEGRRPRRLQHCRRPIPATSNASVEAVLRHHHADRRRHRHLLHRQPHPRSSRSPPTSSAPRRAPAATPPSRWTAARSRPAR